MRSWPEWARSATEDQPGGESRTGSPEAPGAAQWSATQAGQRIERRLESLQQASPGEFDQVFRDLLGEDLAETRALHQAVSRNVSPALAAHAEARLPILDDHAQRLSALSGQ